MTYRLVFSRFYRKLKKLQRKDNSTSNIKSQKSLILINTKDRDLFVNKIWIKLRHQNKIKRLSVEGFNVLEGEEV